MVGWTIPQPVDWLTTNLIPFGPTIHQWWDGQFANQLFGFQLIIPFGPTIRQWWDGQFANQLFGFQLLIYLLDLQFANGGMDNLPKGHGPCSGKLRR